MIKPYSKDKKKVFISFVSADAKLAKALRSFIIKKFKGKIGVYLPSRKMQLNQFSNAKLRTYLEKSHAVIALMTANSLDQPWLYMDWKSQGLSGEGLYILQTEELRLLRTDFKQPFESAVINDTNSFTAFVRKFSGAFLGDDYPAPLDEVKLFRYQVARVMSEMADDKVRC
ncbi:TIR domain-containing protein [Mucilaginibacter rubeus]|uniref:TIR domain-containing protein n=1 Tax=Mucilaginibacter rubeus TaxID=2027860 RepID=A0A5C1I1N0_9SPHI|nr:TIR domain-containing protein [Mucilaginibacter rubeus]QEM11706.1 TIR domain-containing protein [Mucilaginibacter rubeus]